MSNAIRFLGFAVMAWVGVRAASITFGSASIALASPTRDGLPPAARTLFDPPPPPDPLPRQAYYPGMPQGYGPVYPAPYPPYYPRAHGGYPAGDRTIVIPASWPTNPPLHQHAGGWAGIMPTPQPLYYVPLSPEPWPGTTSASTPPMRSSGSPSSMPRAPAPPPRFDRLQLTAWALLRGTGYGTIPSTSLASGGTLGGSQAGARLSYRFSHAWAASLRASSSVGGVRGAEVAGGIRWQPLPSIPIAFTAERREGIGEYGGRSAFALFAEGGLYHRALFNKVYLDGYLQGGVVGFNKRDLFVDGGATLTRPIWRNISGGFGVWGAAQPGLSRLDAGPRISMQVRRGIRVHADYRLRLIGNADPSSGPAITLAADF